nr:nucleoid-associated protein [uncultured Anaeromusa sp.]
MLDVSLMTLDKIIVHGVPNARLEDAPSFSDEPLTLEQNALNALSSRIVDVVGQGSHCVEMQLTDHTEASVAKQVSSIMNDFHTDNDSVLIQKSMSVAQKLYTTQSNPNIPSGLLLCLTGRAGATQEKFVALIKAEKQSGFQVSSLNNVRFISDLFLTEAQRLYKIGFFVSHATSELTTTADLQVHVFDKNATSTGTIGLAAYFSCQFLGCAPLENSARQTEKFYLSTKDFITQNNSLVDEEKFDLINALHVYLKNDQSTIINTQSFATSYFQNPEIRQQYISRLASEDFPSTAITKDTSKISRKLNIRKMRFNSGVKITFPSDSPQSNNDLLRIEGYNKDTDYTTACIKGRIESQ